MRDPLALVAHLAVSSLQEAEDMGLQWGLYQCTEREACDRFRAAVDEYVACRRSNRTRSASDPALTPVCADPREGYDRVSVSRVENPAWLHWERRAGSSSPTSVTVDIPGEFVLLSTARGDITGAQRLTVEPPFNSAVFIGGIAYNGGMASNPIDAFGMLGLGRMLTQSSFGMIGIGVQWGVRLGTSLERPPPFGIRGLVSPSLTIRHHFTAELAVEWWLAPVGMLYEFKEQQQIDETQAQGGETQDHVGYNLHPGTMIGLTAVWFPFRTPFFHVRAVLMGVARSTSPQTAELYGPLLGTGWEF